MYVVTRPGDPSARAALPAALAAALETLTADLLHEGYAVRSELRLRDVAAGRYRVDFLGPSVRLDVEDLATPGRTLALRLYSGGASRRRRHGPVVVVTGLGEIVDRIARSVEPVAPEAHPVPLDLGHSRPAVPPSPRWSYSKRAPVYGAPVRAPGEWGKERARGEGASAARAPSSCAA